MKKILEKYISYQLIIGLIIISQNVSGQVDNQNTLNKFKLLSTPETYSTAITLDKLKSTKFPSEQIKYFDVRDTSLLSSMGLKFKFGSLNFYKNQLYKIEFASLENGKDFYYLYDLGISNYQNLIKKIEETLEEKYIETTDESFFYKNFYRTWSGEKNEIVVELSIPKEGYEGYIHTCLILRNKALDKSAKLSGF